MSVTRVPDKYSAPHRIRWCKGCEEWKTIGEFKWYWSGNWKYRKRTCKACLQVSNSYYVRRSRQRAKGLPLEE